MSLHGGLRASALFKQTLGLTTTTTQGRLPFGRGHRAFATARVVRQAAAGVDFEYADFASRTRKVICIGRNYVDHIKELGNVAGKEPFFFLKPPSSLLAPGAGPVQLPRNVNSHFEIELGLVVGKTLRDVRKEDRQHLLDSVAGYFLAIDMTARNIQEEVKRKGLPWTTAKGFDTYLPVSKYLTRAQVPDPENVVLTLHVNGEEKQHDGTSLMIYKIPVRLFILLMFF